jgi:hypothetical protein
MIYYKTYLSLIIYIVDSYKIILDFLNLFLSSPYKTQVMYFFRDISIIESKN